MSVNGVNRASAEALLLIEADSGKVLFAENATYPWYPASLTKVMTAYVVLKAVKEGRITLDTLLPVSQFASVQKPAKMGLPPGSQITVDNALKMLMVRSANDVAVVLAEGVSGSVENFADAMNIAAQRLGMTQTSFVNPNGMPAEDQISSARDLAILARALLLEFPEYDYYWRIPAIRFAGRTTQNYNKLLGRYPGADGMKTGFICASGFNLLATATRKGRRLIAVVLGAHSSGARTLKAAQLLERGFNGGGLGWIAPSLGTVDSLRPIDAAPPDLRDTICSPKRKKPPAEDSDDDDDTVAGEEPNPTHTFKLSNLGPSVKPSSLLGPKVEAAPIEVYVGPSRRPAELQFAGTRAKLEKARKVKLKANEEIATAPSATVNAAGTSAAQPSSSVMSFAPVATPTEFTTNTSPGLPPVPRPRPNIRPNGQ
ncbi:MAG TPA: serine hydrolase [Xanthobacteraceae bacterium]|nr:serine hydrolase [Xanthobacteraceae bacterium]